MAPLSTDAQRFVDMLNEPVNTLGRTEEAVELILADPALIEDLYRCYFQPDEWARLRVSSSFKRLWRADEQLVAPYLDGFVNTVSAINQPSINWTFAQMCRELDHLLTPKQRSTATERLKHYLDNSDDWIVQNSTIETLTHWAVDDPTLATWLKPRLEQFTGSTRKSVAARAGKALDRLG